MDLLPEFVGGSGRIAALRETVRRLLTRHERSGHVPAILILGETGVGKSLLARAIHRASPRTAGPFVAVNCAAIPESLLESELFGYEQGAFTDARRPKPGLLKTAHRGTLLLDEVGALPAALQGKLLTFLEDRMIRPLGSTRSESVDVALMAATNADLPAAVRSARFRRDLYHRLAVVTLEVPPLRERGDDVLSLADHLLALAGTEVGGPARTFTPEARAAIAAHAWPGNVRELVNAIERALALSEDVALGPAALGLPVATRPMADTRRAAPGVDERSAGGEGDEAARLARVLEETGWNISRTAARLGLSRNTVRLRIEQYDLQPGGRGAITPDRRPAAQRSSGRAAAPPAHNLPRQLTTFIGREREIAQVERLIGAARLVTLTGAGGSGKTRLALETGETVLARFPEGVWFVDLATLTDPALVPQVVAATLGVNEDAGRALTDTLVASLRERRLLLILDNGEHLIAACAALVSTVLRECAVPRILVTSRQSLGVYGEVIWQVPSLSLPAPDGPASVDELVRHEAIRLFVERAAAVQPGFALGPGNALAVAQVCYRLDGIPLAIELAAARMKVLGVDQINARLHERFRLLTANSRTAPARHETLAAAMDWSHELLAADERVVLRRLSAFAGSFSLEAAEGIAAGPGIDGSQVLDLLHRLVDRSLVNVEAGTGAARYRLLETIREYARDKLRASGEEPDVLARHLRWFLAFAERVEQDFLDGVEHHTLLSRWETEYDNVRAAMACRTADPAGDDARLRLAGLMRRFWYVRGSRFEGRAWLERLLRETSPAPSLPRADALSALGQVFKRQGDVRAATARHEEALAIRRSLDDAVGTGVALNNLGMLELDKSDYRRATAFLEEGLAIWSRVDVPYQAALARNTLARIHRRQGDLEGAARLGEDSLQRFRSRGHTYGIADTLACLGDVALDRGDVAGAEARFTEALALGRQINEFNCIADALAGLGEIALRRGDLARARSLAEETLALRRRVDHPLGIAASLGSLGRIALRQQRLPDAAALLAESLATCRSVGDRVGLAEVVETLAAVHAASGDPGRAARLAGAADMVRDEIGAPPAARARADLEAALAPVRAALGADAFAAARAEGRASSLPGRLFA